MTAIDQHIWMERVKKENAERNKFALASALNAKYGHACNNNGVVRQFVKDSRMSMKLKHAPYYMLDSTYTIPSNPNTMRDTGPTRNAEYIIRDDIDSVIERRSNASSAQRSTISKNAVSAKKIRGIINEMDKMKETMISRCHHNKPQSMTRQAGSSKTSGFSFLNPVYAVHPPKIIESVNIHSLNGYTKNISELLFSPGLNTRPKTAGTYDLRKSVAIPKTPVINETSSPVKSRVDLKSNLSATKTRYSNTEEKPRRNNKEHVKSIKSALQNEKDRRRHLENEVQQLKDQMSTIAKSVKSIRVVGKE